jgi:hypothetical protein
VKAKKLRSGTQPPPSGDTAQRQKWRLHTPLFPPAPGRDFEKVAYMVAGAMELGGETGKTGHEAILKSIKSLCSESSVEKANELSTIKGIATLATAYLMFTPKEKLRELAREVDSWPVLATTNPDWHSQARNYLTTIELGAGTIKGRISDLAYSPAGAGDWREWARCAVETMDQNRTTFQVKGFRALVDGKPRHASF